MPTTTQTVPVITLNDGATIPQLGYGTLALQPDRDVSDENTKLAARTVSQALRAGYRHIDTAQAYGTQPGLARRSPSPGSHATRSTSPASWPTPTTHPTPSSAPLSKR